ncbi:MAG TPA: peptide deformylase [Vicinamibacterales bacterium]|nr:peptide deformylase [Vicinamibacterales bacterium]
MAILKVAYMGHPVLRGRARELQPSEIRSPDIQQLIDDLFETMAEYQGIGLAAPQVHEAVRLFVAGYDNDEGDQGFPRIALINPQITVVDTDMVEDWEGCLSVPEIRGRVPRAREIKVAAYDRNGKKIELEARNYIARVIQHETDHLDGVLFLDRMRNFDTLTFLDEFERYWSREAVTPE